MSGHRAERIGDLVRQILARAIGEVRDPWVGFVTVTEVRMSPDFRHATVYFTVIDLDRREGSEKGLSRAGPFLRRALAREAGLRYTPELHFAYDEALESGRRVESLLSGLPPEAEPHDGGEE